MKPPPTATHISVDSGTDDSADDDIERSVEEPSVVAASLVIASLIVVPLSVVLVITLCARLYRQGAALIPAVLSSCLLSVFTRPFYGRYTGRPVLAGQANTHTKELKEKRGYLDMGWGTQPEQSAALIPAVLCSCLLSMFTDHSMVIIRVDLC